jgi:hypothetical protein
LVCPGVLERIESRPVKARFTEQLVFCVIGQAGDGLVKESHRKRFLHARLIPMRQMRSLSVSGNRNLGDKTHTYSSAELLTCIGVNILGEFVKWINTTVSAVEISINLPATDLAAPNVGAKDL